MINNDPVPNPEARNEALRTDYREVAGRLPTGIVIGGKLLSIYRPEETHQTLQRMEHHGPIIISGSHGAGKSSLLRLMEAEVKAQGRPTLHLAAHTLGGNRAEVDIAILHGDEYEGVKRAESFDDLVADLKDKNGLLMVDEFTHAFIQENHWVETEGLRTFMVKASKAGVPLAVVVHAYPKYLRKALEMLPFVDESRIVIPRYITYDEIQQAMLSGAVYKRGEKPRNPQVLQVEESAVRAVADLAGQRPAIVNYFLQNMYMGEQRKDPLPPIVTAQSVEEYFNQHRRHLVDSSTMERVMKIGLTLLEDPKQLGKFTNTFLSNIDEIDHGTMTLDDVKVADADSIDSNTKKEWIDAGLIVENDGKLSVNGLLTAVAVTKKYIY